MDQDAASSGSGPAIQVQRSFPAVGHLVRRTLDEINVGPCAASDRVPATSCASDQSEDGAARSALEASRMFIRLWEQPWPKVWRRRYNNHTGVKIFLRREVALIDRFARLVLLENLGQHDNEFDFALQYQACRVHNKK